MWFVQLAINSIVGFIVAKSGQELGNLGYRLLCAQWDYFWAKAEEGYFLDFPEDQDRDNTPENLAKRVMTVIKYKEDGERDI